MWVKAVTSWQKALLWLGFLAVAALAGFLWLEREQPAVAGRVLEQLPGLQPGKSVASSAPVAVTEPKVGAPSSPLPELHDPALPLLGESDGEIARALAALPGGETALALVVRRDLLRRFVMTVDQLPSARMPVKTRLWAPVPGAFAVDELDGEARIGAANTARYQPLVAAVLAVEPGPAVALYRRWYPLLQAAYVEASGSNALFQSRLLAAIDDLVALRIPTEPPRLVQEEGVYKFAEPALERQSAGAKALLRLGAEEGVKVQQRLREYRALLAGTAAR